MCLASKKLYIKEISLLENELAFWPCFIYLGLLIKSFQYGHLIKPRDHDLYDYLYFQNSSRKIQTQLIIFIKCIKMEYKNMHARKTYRKQCFKIIWRWGNNSWKLLNHRHSVIVLKSLLVPAEEVLLIVILWFFSICNFETKCQGIFESWTLM